MTPRWENTFLFVLRSNSLVSLDWTEHLSRASDLPRSLLLKVKRNKDTLRCATLGKEVPGQRQEQLLLMCAKNALLLTVQKLKGDPSPLTLPLFQHIRPRKYIKSRHPMCHLLLINHRLVPNTLSYFSPRMKILFNTQHLQMAWVRPWSCVGYD